MNKLEHTVLPNWLYPLGFWLGLFLLAIGLFVPNLSWLGIIWLGVLPISAALWVAITSWKKDRHLSLSAIATLGGLALVFIVKSLL